MNADIGRAGNILNASDWMFASRKQCCIHLSFLCDKAISGIQEDADFTMLRACVCACVYVYIVSVRVYCACVCFVRVYVCVQARAFGCLRVRLCVSAVKNNRKHTEKYYIFP